MNIQAATRSTESLKFRSANRFIILVQNSKLDVNWLCEVGKGEEDFLVTAGTHDFGSNGQITCSKSSEIKQRRLEVKFIIFKLFFFDNQVS